MPNNKITYSSELMVNFMKATIVAPQQKFQALQTPDGYALLFSIGSDNVFYVTQQSPGLATGWQQVDLSAALSAIHGNGKLTAKTFAVSQNLTSKKFSIALAVTVDGKDHLYLSVNNITTADNSAPLAVTWTAVPYDDPDHAGMSPIIEHLYIAQAKKEEYIVVDISRSTFDKGASDLLERYYIDQQKPNNRAWNNLVVGGDVEGGNIHTGVSSILGRKAGAKVEGMYTLGTIRGATQLMYAPLYSQDRISPPSITRFQMPAGATAIAVADTGDRSTDLFVAAGGALYYFAAASQKDRASGIKLLSHELFSHVTHLYAYISNGIYVVWGLNQANQVFYTSCRKEDIGKEGFWTIPMPILAGVTQVSPYLNAADTSNTFFAVTGDKFKKAVQSPVTSLWEFQDITLEAPRNAKAESFSSYTTRIQLTDSEDQILADTELTIRASSRGAVYINHLYYVLTPKAITVKTDLNGSITIMEAVEDLSGLRLFVGQEGATEIEINPMEKPFQRLASLDNADKLEAATIEHHDGSSRKLITNATREEMDDVAAANVSLGKVYNSVSRNNLRYSPHTPNLLVTSMPATGNMMYVEGIGNTILSDLGNIFSWLATGVEHVIKLVQDTASNVWRFVVYIGGKIYQGVLDCVEKVVAAVKWVYEKIKTAIEDLIKFLEFLFQWKDFRRTKDVIYNITRRYLEHELKQIPKYKKSFDDNIQQLIQTISDWAGIVDGADLGDMGNAPVRKKSKPTEGQSAPGSLLTSHYTNNVSQGESFTTLKERNISMKLIDDLLEALVKEGEVFLNAINQMQALLAEAPRLSLIEILKKIAGIFATNLLRGFQYLADALFNIIYDMGMALLDMFTEKIRIPVVSDILEFFGVPSVSVLDLMCWITAIPATLISKLVAGETPFKAGSLTDALINAPDMQTIIDLFKEPRKVTVSDGLMADHKSNMYYAGHLIVGTATIILSFVTVLEAADQTGNSLISYSSIVLGVVAAGMSLATAIVSPRHPVENVAVMAISVVVASLCLLNKGVFSSIMQDKFAASKATSSVARVLNVKNPRAIGAFLDALLAVAAAGLTGYHFYELSKKPAERERSQAIIEETSNVTAYLTRISYAGAVKGVPYCLPLLGVFCCCTGGLHVTTARVEKA